MILNHVRRQVVSGGNPASLGLSLEEMRFLTTLGSCPLLREATL